MLFLNVFYLIISIFSHRRVKIHPIQVSSPSVVQTFQWTGLLAQTCSQHVNHFNETRNCHSPLLARQGNLVEIMFAKTSGTAPITDRGKTGQQRTSVSLVTITVTIAGHIWAKSPLLLSKVANLSRKLKEMRTIQVLIAPACDFDSIFCQTVGDQITRRRANFDLIFTRSKRSTLLIAIRLRREVTL